MALNNADTREFINQVVNISGKTALEIIRANQGGKSPAKPYVTYLYLGNQTIGASPITSHTESAGQVTEYVTSSRTPVLEVQFFTQTEHQALSENIASYEDANEIAQRFEDHLKTDRVKRYMREKGFSVLSIQTTTNLDEYLGDRWERRAVVELTMNDISEITNDVESFNHPATFTITAEDI